MANELEREFTGICERMTIHWDAIERKIMESIAVKLTIALYAKESAERTRATGTITEIRKAVGQHVRSITPSGAGTLLTFHKAVSGMQPMIDTFITTLPEDHPEILSAIQNFRAIALPVLREVFVGKFMDTRAVKRDTLWQALIRASGVSNPDDISQYVDMIVEDRLAGKMALDHPKT